MGRAPCCDKNGLKKGPWTPEEDEKLRDYIQKHGHGRWRTLPMNSGLSRCGKSCRLRWTNYLRPDIKRGRFSFEEEQVIIELHSILGNKWSAIAARLPGRTDNEIKNFWNTHIRKRLLRMGVDPVTHSPRLDLLDLSTLLNVAALCSNPSQLDFTTLLGVQPALNAELLRMATSLLLGQCQNAELVHQNQLQEEQQQQTPQQFPNPTIEEQFQPSFPPQQLLPNLAQEIPVRTPSSAPLAQANVGSQLHSSDQETLIWPNSSLPCSVRPDSFLLPQNSEFYGGTQSIGAFDLVSTETATDFVPSSSSQEYFSFPSVLSTPATSPTPLNSPSTYVNSAATTTEDERDSYCSNLLDFQMPDLLDDVGELIM